MKSTIQIVIITFLLLSCSREWSNPLSPDEDQKPDIPTLGLVAYYPFNGNANDESGNGNNGNVQGATLTADRFGVDKRAYIFDGINDFIDLGNGEALNLGAFGSFYSLLCWFKTSGNVGPYQDNLIGKSLTIGGRPDPYNLLLGLNNSIKFQITSNTQNYNITSPNTYNNSDWHFAVGIKDNNILSLYINGSLVVGPTLFSIPDVKSSANTYIGSYTTSPASGELFNGYIDDIRLFNRALSQEEIQALYHEGGWVN